MVNNNYYFEKVHTSIDAVEMKIETKYKKKEAYQK